MRDSKQEQIKTQNIIAQYKVMHGKAQAENDELNKQVSKQNGEIDKFKRNEKLAEQVIDKLYTIAGRKDVLINDMDSLLEAL